MAWLSRNFLHSSFNHLIPAVLLSRWNGKDDLATTEISDDALIYDPKTGRYKLKKEIFDQLLADAAQSVWLDRKG